MVREQVFVSEPTEGFYFLAHWCAVGRGSDESPSGGNCEAPRLRPPAPDYLTGPVFYTSDPPVIGNVT